MSDKKYEVRFVNMDEKFNTSISDCVCGEFDSLREARRQFALTCKEIEKDRRTNSKWWQDNAPVYVARELYVNYGDEDYEDWHWEHQVETREFRLQKENRIKGMMNECKANLKII